MLKKMTAAGAAILVAAGLTLTGCAGEEKRASSTDSYLETAEELRDAAVEAGAECEGWEALEDYYSAKSAGKCADGSVYAVFYNTGYVLANADDIQLETGKPALLDANWAIVADQGTLDKVADKLGGDVQEGPAAEPEAEKAT